MKLLKNMPIGKKLFVTFAAILLLFTLTTTVTVVSLIQLKDSYEYMSNTVLTISNKVNLMRMDIQSAAKFIMYATAADNEQESEQYIQSAAKDLDSLREGIEFLYANSSVDRTIIDNFQKNMENSVQYKEKIFQLVREGKGSESQDFYLKNYYPVLIKANEYLLQISDFASTRASETYIQVNNQITATFIILFAVVAVTFAGTVILGIYITRSLKAPITEIEAAARKIASGELKEVTIEYKSPDELGALADSMRTTVSGLSKIISDIAYITECMADGNFNIKTTQEESYKGEFRPILMSMRKMNKNLSSTLSQITSASEQVSAGAEQMSVSAQNLAEGATEQAGAVEELLATIVNITEGVDRTSESVSEVYEMSRQYSHQAGQSHDEVQTMMNAMQRITETSKKIEGIITEIEDIASQTNLLSLNASIEAARAGEAGRGFAVVADQIGKLAEESAKSAVNTRELIMSSIQEIDEGTHSAQRTAQTIEEVVQGMNRITESAKDLSALSKEQAEAMKQAETGVNQISEVVQSNSATAEETSATSEELSAQSINMDSLIKKFELRVD